MKKRLIQSVSAVLAAALLLPLAASASNFYIIPDSDRRPLTYDELWQWRYEALGYIFNEIFARHGYPFDPGGPYERWFSSQSWYRMNPRLTKAQCYARLSNLEWNNERLVKQVLQEMRDLGTKNPGGKTLPNLEPDLLNIPDLFEEYIFEPGQRLEVYSGPGAWYHRGASGKALVSTNGTVYVAGWDSGWLMVLYRLNNGGARIGYVEGSAIKGSVWADALNPQMRGARILRTCGITDDPVSTRAPLATLGAGDAVTFLFPMVNREVWAYVEANTSAGLLRGCVPFDALNLD